MSQAAAESGFDEDWPGWQWETPPDELTDTMLDPEGGLALVRVEASPRQLLADMDELKSERIPNDNYTHYYLYQQDSSGSHLPNPIQDITRVFPEFTERMDSLAGVLRMVMEPVRLALDTDADADIQKLTLNASKKVTQRGHIDPALLRAWVGSTKPGFFVVRGGETIAIDSLPEEHVLLMRGSNAAQGGVRHGAIYRGKDPRLTLLSEARKGSHWDGVNWGEL